MSDYKRKQMVSHIMENYSGIRVVSTSCEQRFDSEFNGIMSRPKMKVVESHCVNVNGDYSISEISLELAFKLALAKLNAAGKRVSNKELELDK